MAANPKSKGKRGELEVARLLTNHGWAARRSAQYSGLSGEDADICCAAFPWHLEVKRTERLNLSDALKQAKRDSSKGEPRKPPAVVHRSSRQPWLITLEFEDLLNLMQRRNTGAMQVSSA